MARVVGHMVKGRGPRRTLRRTAGLARNAQRGREDVGDSARSASPRVGHASATAPRLAPDPGRLPPDRGRPAGRLRDWVPGRALVAGPDARGDRRTHRHARRVAACADGVPARNHDGDGIRSVRRAARPGARARRMRSARPTCGPATCRRRTATRAASCYASTSRCASTRTTGPACREYRPVRGDPGQLWTRAEEMAREQPPTWSRSTSSR